MASQSNQSPADPVPDDTIEKHTYRVTRGLHRELGAIAKGERVGRDEVVRFFLAEAIARYKNHQLTIPTEPLETPEERLRERRIISSN